MHILAGALARKSLPNAHFRYPAPLQPLARRCWYKGRKAWITSTYESIPRTARRMHAREVRSVVYPVRDLSEVILGET